MPSETIIRTLKESKEDNPKHILPRTVLKAIADDNGNFISSDVTAQDINNLHGKTFVTAEQQTLTDTQKAQARQNINASAPDGYYGDSGGVYQYSTNFLGKNTPTDVKDLVFRPTASQMSGQSWYADSISGQTATIEKIKGKTLVFNQLCQNGNFASTTGWIGNGGTLAVSDNIGTLTSTSKSVSAGLRNTNFTQITGHKYLVMCDVRLTTGTSNAFAIYYGDALAIVGAISSSWTRKGAIITAKEQSSLQLRINQDTTSVGDVCQYKNVMVIDLTQMFGAGNEPSMVEEFRAMFPFDYYGYNDGELISLNATGLKTTGFNQLYPDGHIDVLAGLTYKIEGTYTSLKDSAGNDVTVTNGEFTPIANDAYTMVGGSCVHLKWSGVRDGETETHWDNTLSIPMATYFPDGMKSAGTVYDELTKDKAVKRIGSRAYQSGDEEDTTIVTDGTTTYYPIETPIETTISPELNLTYRCDDFGTEMLLPQNTDEPVTAPMDADIVYQLDYEAQIRNNDSLNITKESMDNFITAFNASGLGTITQVWDSTNKRYTYTVTAPQPTEGGETV